MCIYLQAVFACLHGCQCACVCVCARSLRGPTKPAPAIDTLSVTHAWVTSYRKEEMRGFGVWHLWLHLKKCMAVFVCECRRYFLVSLWGCTGQRVGLRILWASNRAFTPVCLLHCKCLCQTERVQRMTERYQATLVSEPNWEELEMYMGAQRRKEEKE